jgi:hypothetical protein
MTIHHHSDLLNLTERWSQGERIGPIDDVPPEERVVWIESGYFPQHSTRQWWEVGSQNEDGPGGCSQTTGELSMDDGRFRAKVHRNLPDGNDVLETAVGESYKRPQ